MERKWDCLTMAKGPEITNQDLYNYLKKYSDIGGDLDAKNGNIKDKGVWKPPPDHRCIR